jgi:hypothetical protein
MVLGHAGGITGKGAVNMHISSVFHGILLNPKIQYPIIEDR